MLVAMIFVSACKPDLNRGEFDAQHHIIIEYDDNGRATRTLIAGYPDWLKKTAATVSYPADYILTDHERTLLMSFGAGCKVGELIGVTEDTAAKVIHEKYALDCDS